MKTNLLGLKLCTLPRGEQGQMAFMFMGVMAFLMVIGLMVIDVGLVFGTKRQMQTSVDLAALAGVAELPDDPAAAEAAALDYLRANGLDSADPDVTVTFRYPNPNQLEMRVTAPGRTYFTRLFGISAFDVLGARAVAERQPGVPGTSGPGGGAPPVPVPSAPPPATAAIDGLVTPADGYTKLGDLFGGSTDYGDVYFGRGGGFISFAAVLNGPGSGGGVGNENVYACKPGNPGKSPKKGECTDSDHKTYHTDFNTGWAETDKGKHTYKDLLGSDRAHFQISCDGNVVHDFEQDYLRDDGAGGWISDAAGDGEIVTLGPAQSASSLEWNLEHPAETGWGDDPGENPLTQSPPFYGSYPYVHPEYSGWEWRMIYEFSVPEAAYADCDGPVEFTLAPIIGGKAGAIGGLHSSPGKTAEGVFLQVASVEDAIWLVE